MSRIQYSNTVYFNNKEGSGKRTNDDLVIFCPGEIELSELTELITRGVSFKAYTRLLKFRLFCRPESHRAGLKLTLPQRKPK